MNIPATVADTKIVKTMRRLDIVVVVVEYVFLLFVLFFFQFPPCPGTFCSSPNNCQCYDEKISRNQNKYGYGLELEDYRLR